MLNERLHPHKLPACGKVMVDKMPNGGADWEVNLSVHHCNYGCGYIILEEGLL